MWAAQCGKRFRIKSILLLGALLTVVSCGGGTASQSFDVVKVITVGDIILGDIPKGTRVDVYPNYVIIRRPAPDLATMIPMHQVKAIDVK